MLPALKGRQSRHLLTSLPPFQGVRREGVGFQWVRIPPGNLVILAGSSSSDSGGNKRVEALNDKGSLSDSASEWAVTYVNAEQASKTGIAGADPPPLQGKATAAPYRGMTLASPRAVLPG
jgi:hypothetical protein